MVEQQYSVFISYARADDEPFVEGLKCNLTKAGVRVWWDREAMESRGRTFLQEIQDAIEGVDRVIAVVGPKALESKYVRYEWGHAQLFAKVIIPVLRLGEYEDVPTELVPDGEGGLAVADLGDFHCLDFREGRSYDDALGELLRILAADLPSLAEIGETPRLPRHFVSRRDELRRIQKAVLADVHRPTVVLGADQIVALQGMGGTGKSVLAAAFVRMIDTRRAFEDGITWLTAGERADVSNLLDNIKRLWIAFKGDIEDYADDVEARSRLSEVLAQKVCLIVLDDVWSPGQVEVIANALGPRCRLLITTRDQEIAAGFARHLPLDVFSEAESLSLLAEWSLQPREELPQEAWEVARECGNLPLTLAMVGAMVRGHPDRWDNALHKLRTADLEKLKRQFPNYPYPNLLKAIEVSVEALEPVDRARYLDLAVFRRQTPISEDTLRILWEPVGLGPFDTQDLIDLLIRRSLVRQDLEGRVTLHALQADYMIAQTEDLAALHRRLLDAYDAACPGGWSTGPNDGYFFENLAHHLVEVRFADDLLHLLVDGPEWMEAKFQALLSDSSTLDDLRLARAHHESPLAAFQLGMATQIIESRARTYTPNLLMALVLLGRKGEAQAHARLKANPFEKIDALLAIYDASVELGKPFTESLDEALFVARAVSGVNKRMALIAERQASLDPAGAIAVFEEAERRALSLQEVDSVTRALGDLCHSYLRIKNPDRARCIALRIEDSYSKVDALCRIAVDRLRAQGAEATDAIDEAIGVLRRESPWPASQFLKFVGDLASEGYSGAGELLKEVEGMLPPIDGSKIPRELDKLRMLALVKLGRVDEAIGVLASLEEPTSAYDLVPFVRELGRVNRIDDALAIIVKLEAPFWQPAYDALAPFLAKAGRHEEVRWVAQQTTPLHRESLLSTLASVFIEESRFDEALEILGTIKDSDYRFDLEDHLALSLARAGDGRAETLIQSFKKIRTESGYAYDHFPALCRVAFALHQSGQYDPEPFLETAEGMLEGGDDPLPECRVELAAVLALVGELDRAIRLLSAVERDEDRTADAFLVLALQALRDGDPRSTELFDMAEEFATDEDNKKQVFSALRDLANEGGHDLGVLAEVFAWSMFDTWSGGARRDFAVALMSSGNMQDGEQAIPSVTEDISSRVEALALLAGHLHEAGDERAAKLVAEVEESVHGFEDYKVEFGQVALVEAYARVGRVDEASQFAKVIASFDGQRKVRSILAACHARAHRFGEAMDELRSLSIDEYLGEVASWAPYLEQVSPGFASVSLRELMRIAGWIRPDWRRLSARLP